MKRDGSNPESEGGQMARYEKRHYEDIATILFEGYQHTDGPAQEVILELLTNDFADLFADDNPRFDRKRFKKAVDNV